MVRQICFLANRVHALEQQLQLELRLRPAMSIVSLQEAAAAVTWARNTDVGPPARAILGARNSYDGTDRVADRPAPGHFALRLMSHRRWLDEGRSQYGGGVQQPWVPALIYAPCPAVLQDPLAWPYHPEWDFEPLGRSPYPLRASIAEKDLDDSWAMRVWNSGRQISAGAYAWLMARRAWARRWAPASYEAQPADLSWIRNLE